VEASAEALPAADDSVDAAMALLTVHHWNSLEAGTSELRRIARQRIVILTFDPDINHSFWLLRKYLPEAAALMRWPHVSRRGPDPPPDPGAKASWPNASLPGGAKP
jgi:ubiquinone/menaquinone biosynthesis C-methylase UbiE